MKRSLLVRFLVLYILVAGLGLAFIATFSYRIVFNNRLSALENNLYATAYRLAGEYSSTFNSNNLSAADNSRMFVEIERSLNCKITALTKVGYIIYPVSNAMVQFPNFDPTKSDSHHGFRGSLYTFFDDDAICVYAPVVSNYQTLGYFIVSQDGEDLNIVVNQTLNTVYLTAGVIYVLFLPILLMLYIWVIRPVDKLTKAAREYSNGNLNYSYKYKSSNELGELSAAMSFMSRELARTGEDQKKFITNVSHDFRSPLTSIKGYIEAMLDGTIPPSMQNKYLNVVKDETERLSKLTQSLLDLNTISRDGTMLEYSDFDVHHIVKKILATFEGRCMDKGISFELTFVDHELFVHADMSKIQQVLYNLIDNAIKFSQPGSQIFIETSEKKGKAYISVKDQGVGISADNLKKIWDRFYKTDTSRGRDKKGLGLGLSIVKDIINAHGETIDVISTEGVGTEFIFSLQISQNE